jgi:hypothetical protein
MVSKIIEPKNNFTHIFLEEDQNNILDRLLTLWKMIEFVQKRIWLLGCFGCWRLLISSTEYSRSQLHRMCDTLFSAFFVFVFVFIIFFTSNVNLGNSQESRQLDLSWTFPSRYYSHIARIYEILPACQLSAIHLRLASLFPWLVLGLYRMHGMQLVTYLISPEVNFVANDLPLMGSLTWLTLYR